MKPVELLNCGQSVDPAFSGFSRFGWLGGPGWTQLTCWFQWTCWIRWSQTSWIDSVILVDPCSCMHCLEPLEIPRCISELLFGFHCEPALAVPAWTQSHSTYLSPVCNVLFCCYFKKMWNKIIFSQSNFGLYSSLTKTSPKYQIMYHKKDLLHDFTKMTLLEHRHSTHCVGQGTEIKRRKFWEWHISMICLCSKYFKNWNIFGQILNIWVKMILKKKIWKFFFYV